MTDELELPPRGIVTLFRRPLILDDRGIRLGRRAIAWDDVEFYTYRWEDGLVDGQIYIVARDDRWLRLDRHYYYWRQGADRVLAELHPRLRRDPDYHPFRLTDTELSHRGSGALALTEIDRVELVSYGGSPHVVVIARGSPNDWSHDPVEAVHDLILLLEDLAARGVHVHATIPFWLPPAVAEIAETLVSEVRLPRATIVRR